MYDKLKAAGWLLIALGIAETAMLIYAFVAEASFAGGGPFYCYVGYKLLKKNASTYKWTSRLAALGVAFFLAAPMSALTTGVQCAFANAVQCGWDAATGWLIVLPYLLVTLVLVALLFHPSTRIDLALPARGTSLWTLYLGASRALGLLVLSLAITGALMGPHLLSNPFQAAADAVRARDDVGRKLGKIGSVTILSHRVFNWTFSAEVRVEGSKGTGSYYIDIAPDGSATIDAYAYENVGTDSTIPRLQSDPAVPEASAETAPDDVVTLLSTSFEEAEGMTIRPFVQDGKVAWAADTRARSGQRAVNAVPEGNPGRLDYFARPMSFVLLSSRLDGQYASFKVDGFSKVDLEFWRLSTSNPSKTHNCLGSVSIDYRLDKGPWQSRMVYCGTHKSTPPEWRRSHLEFAIRGHRELEFRFEYEFPPETRVDKTVVYLIDDLQVRASK